MDKTDIREDGRDSKGRFTSACAADIGTKANVNLQCISKAIQENKAIKQNQIKPKRIRRITPEIQEYIRDSLTAVDKRGKPYVNRFIDAFLKEAKADPSSKPGLLLASTIFDKQLLEVLDSEINKQMNRDIAFAEYRIRTTLYDKQMAPYDNNIDKQILIICSRRAGKSELNARLIAKRALRPNQHIVYINRSFDAAVRQISGPLDKALEAAGIKYKGTLSGGKIDFDNGSWLLVIGNNNVADVNKVRGEKVALVILDECGHQRNIKQLMQEVIEPATMDYEDSQIIFTGTPPRTKNTYIGDLWNNPNIRKYHWTFVDNPFIPNRDNVIKEVCERNGVTPDSAFVRREYFGDMNAYDTEALYIKKYETYDKIPDIIFSHCWIGVDFGYEDKAAIITVLADKNTKTLYVEKGWAESKKGITEISVRIRDTYEEVKNKYKLAREPWVITDTNEKGATYDLRQVYKIPNVFCAYKYNKDEALEMMSDWFKSGTIKVNKSNEALIRDADNMVWQRDPETDKILHELDDESYHGNSMFALLYVSRQAAVDIFQMFDLNKEAKRV